MELETKLKINKDLMDAPNLMDRLSDKDLATIGTLVWEGYSRDKQSRIVWERRMESGMDLAMQIQKDKNFPWTGCSNVIFPLVTIAALQFSARSYSNIIQGTDVVRYRVVGEDPSGKVTERANLISKHMSWQVLEEDT
jgi:chaperonin GroES